MSLRDRLLSVKPRETAGAISARAFDFQNHWALAHLLDLHLTDLDYRVLFDYHDDVVVLEPADSPVRVHFYQVKSTTKAHWTRGTLLARKKGKNAQLHSILGKLLSHLLDFQDDTASLNLVSNAPFKLALPNAQDTLRQDKFALHGLASHELDAIKEAINDELRAPLTCAGDDITFFHVTSLSLKDHAAHLKGLLVDFLATACPGRNLSPQAMYKSLLAEATRRTASDITPDDFHRLCTEKSLSRTDIDTMISLAQAGETFKDIWSTLDNALRSEGFSLSDIASLRNVCNTYLVERMDPTDALLRDMTRAVSSAFDASFPADTPLHNLTQLFTAVGTWLSTNTPSLHADMYDGQWKAIAMVIAHERKKL